MSDIFLDEDIPIFLERRNGIKEAKEMSPYNHGVYSEYPTTAFFNGYLRTFKGSMDTYHGEPYSVL